MKQEDLQQVVPGFDDPVRGSQVVFRRALQALSLPGLPVDMPAVATRMPSQGHGAAALLLLALLDSDCTLWLSPSLKNSDAHAWLRFHTGCSCIDDPSQARFLWLAAGDEWPALADMNAGSDEYPDRSATCVMEVGGLQSDGEGQWVLQGPGIQGQRRLTTQGLPADFDAQWSGNHAAFPRGVDLFLATRSQLLGVPRSTRLQRNVTLET